MPTARPDRRRAARSDLIVPYTPPVPPGPKPVLTLGHSPDPDDAFMWWPLGDAGPPGTARPARAPLFDTGRFLFRPILADIETLNRRADPTVGPADLDITALSAFAYPAAKERYAITSCGSSMGDGYGPKIVARETHDTAWLSQTGVRIAIPGERTSAYLALRLLAAGPLTTIVTPFETIIDEVVQGRADAGVVIHEGQLTFQEKGLALVADLGQWWKSKTGLPLPLGLNAVRRDLDARFGEGALRDLALVLRSSIEYSLRKRPIALRHAMQHARGLTEAQADRFVNMYVSALTRDMGQRGAEAIRAFLGRGAQAGLCEDPGRVDVVEPAGGSVALTSR